MTQNHVISENVTSCACIKDRLSRRFYSFRPKLNKIVHAEDPVADAYSTGRKIASDFSKRKQTIREEIFFKLQSLSIQGHLQPKTVI